MPLACPLFWLKRGRVAVPSRSALLLSSSGLPVSHTTTPCCMKPQFWRLTTAPPPVDTTTALKGMSSCRTSTAVRLCPKS